MMLPSFVFILSLRMIGGLEINENVIFQKVNEVSVTRAHWQIALLLDTNVFSTFLTQLETRLNDITNTTKDMMFQFKRNDLLLQTDAFEQSLAQLHTEIEYIRSDHDNVLDSYLDYKTLSHTQKRSLLPLGGFFKFLFGTADDSDIRNIQTHVNQLQESQKTIIHVLQNSLSILNVTQQHITENRHSINTLISTLRQLEDKIMHTHERLQAMTHAVQDYTVNYNSLKIMIDELRQAVFHASLYLETFKGQLNMLSTGKLFPSLISPIHLKDVLLDIATKVPNNLQLPANPKTDLWHYYQSTSTTVVMSPTTIIITMDIPLLEIGASFEVYEVFNFDMPYSPINETINDNKIHYNMSARYELETKGFLIDQARNHYCLLTNNELKTCQARRTCDVQSPFYQVDMSKLCVIAIMINNTQHIKDYCKVIIHPNTVLPDAKYLGSGNWAIVSRQDLRLVTICQDHSQNKISARAIAPIDIVNVPMNCRAYNEYFTLNAWYINSSQTRLQTDKLDIPTFKGSSIWKPFHTSLVNFTKTEMPHELSNIKEIPMEALITKLQSIRQLNDIDTTSGDFPLWGYIIIGVATALSSGAALLIYCKCKRMTRSNRPIITQFRSANDDMHLGEISPPGYVGVASCDVAHEPLVSEVKKPSAPPQRPRTLSSLYPSLRG
ncbi:hypothetical protein DPMN_190377 [Dreissena polymorpha]|uniref:Envelope fusion protein n=2 Tax=Dreissena polymorpha TaxID=45954 RepID=A0A9D4IBX0_DREPO|nr:hypothetical protein DPMN_190377 [Dreissena polymorpha]